MCWWQQTWPARDWTSPTSSTSSIMICLTRSRTMCIASGAQGAAARRALLPPSLTRTSLSPSCWTSSTCCRRPSSVYHPCSRYALHSEWCPCCLSLSVLISHSWPDLLSFMDPGHAQLQRCTAQSPTRAAFSCNYGCCIHWQFEVLCVIVAGAGRSLGGVAGA